MPIRTVMFLALALAVASGCGRRGPLEEPVPESTTVADPAPRAGAVPLTADTSPGAAEPPRAAPTEAPERRFFLDPLI